VVFLFQKSLTDKNQMCVVLPSIEGLDVHVATVNELKIYKFVHSIGELIFDAVTLNSMALQCLYCTVNYYKHYMTFNRYLLIKLDFAKFLFHALIALCVFEFAT